MLPRIRNYGRYKCGNYGSHTLAVEVGGITVWFSYETPIAFKVPGQPVIVSENLWGPTTAKHIRWVMAEARQHTQVSRTTFELLWSAVLRDQGVGLRGGPGHREALREDGPQVD